MNRLDAFCWNDGSAAGFLCALHVTLPDGTASTIVSDGSWSAESCEPAIAKAAEKFTSEPISAKARDVGAYGMAPWGRLEVAQLSDRFEPRPGFRVDVVADSVGSVVGIALDPEGRVYVASEGRSITRLSDPDPASGVVGSFRKVETYTDKIANAQGMFRDGDTLFVTGDGPQGTGLYRVPEATREPELLGHFDGEMGEARPAIVRGPDGCPSRSATTPASPGDLDVAALAAAIQVTCCRAPSTRAATRRGAAPGGVVVIRTRAVALFAGGFRSHYDLCFDLKRIFHVRLRHGVGRRAAVVSPDPLRHVTPGLAATWRAPARRQAVVYAIHAGAQDRPRLAGGVCCCDGTRSRALPRGDPRAGDWSQGQILAFNLSEVARRSPRRRRAAEAAGRCRLPTWSSRATAASSSASAGAGRRAVSTGSRTRCRPGPRAGLRRRLRRSRTSRRHRLRRRSSPTRRRRASCW